jgi:hypothetical protein
MVARIVREALQQRAEYEAWRAGRRPALRGTGLEIGPQRYHDPSIWGPNYELRDELPAGANSRARIAAMERVPPAADRRLLGIARVLAEIDSRHPSSETRPDLSWPQL